MKDEATGVTYNTRSEYDTAMWDTFNKGMAQMPVNPTDVSSAKAIQLPGRSSITDTATSNLSMGINAMPPSQLTSKSSEADVMSTLGRVTPTEQKQLGIISGIEASMKKLLGKSERSAELFQESGLERKQLELNDLDKQLAQESRALENEVRRLSENPRGETESSLNATINSVRTKSLQRQADLSIIKAGVQGDITTAQSIIQQKLDMEFAPIQEEIQYYSQLLELSNMESGILDKKEKDQLNFILSERQNAMDEAKAEESRRAELAFELARLGDVAGARAIQSGQMSISDGIIRTGSLSAGSVGIGADTTEESVGGEMTKDQVKSAYYTYLSDQKELGMPRSEAKSALIADVAKLLELPKGSTNIGAEWKNFVEDAIASIYGTTLGQKIIPGGRGGFFGESQADITSRLTSELGI